MFGYAREDLLRADYGRKKSSLGTSTGYQVAPVTGGWNLEDNQFQLYIRGFSISMPSAVQMARRDACQQFHWPYRPSARHPARHLRQENVLTPHGERQIKNSQVGGCSRVEVSDRAEAGVVGCHIVPDRTGFAVYSPPAQAYQG